MIGKPLPKSWREKKRHVCVQILSLEEKEIKRNELLDAVLFEVKKLYGAEGLATMNLGLADFSKKRAIFTVSKGSELKLRIALNNIREISGKKIILKSVATSGTLKSLIERGPVVER